MRISNNFFVLVSLLIIFCSTMLAQWEAIENEWNNDDEIRDIFTIENYLFVGTSDQNFDNDKLFLSTNNGDSFTNISQNLPDSVSSSSVEDITYHKGNLYIAVSWQIFTSTDLGSNWQEVDHGVDLGLDYLVDYPVISIESDGEVLYAGTYGLSSSSFVLKSEDDGNSWEIAHSANANIERIEATNSYIYFKEEDYRIYKSEPNSEDWIEILSASSGSSLQGLRDFAVNTEGDSIIVNDYVDTLLISTDYGENFTASDVIYGYFVNHSVYSHGTFFVQYRPTFNNSTEGGIMYRNSKTNFEWRNLSDEKYLVTATDMKANDKYLFIQYGDTLITRTDLSNFDIATGVDSEEGVINNYHLNQNYPNPFNPSTKINYSIPKQSNVSLKVYDVLGKEVAELVNTEKQAGSYEINFNAQNLSSGIYFYTLKTTGFLETKKMLLIK